jgi:opacity protein-like surface antigen
MKQKWIFIVVIAGLIIASLPASAEESMGWSLSGGPVWERRTGPGATLAIGGNSCTGDLCDNSVDTNLFGSFGATFGFQYRLMPNLVVYGDLHTAYLNTDADWGSNLRDDKGFLFQFIAGAEFHVPFTGWLDAYLGLGLGYALLRAKAFNGSEDANWEQVISLRGVDIEMKIGVDVYPFSAVPNLALGVLFRWGFTIWPTVCFSDDGNRTCSSPKDSFNPYGSDYALWDENVSDDVSDTPFLVFIGLQAKYIFGKKAEGAAETKTKTP